MTACHRVSWRYRRGYLGHGDVTIWTHTHAMNRKRQPEQTPCMCLPSVRCLSLLWYRERQTAARLPSFLIHSRSKSWRTDQYVGWHLSGLVALVGRGIDVPAHHFRPTGLRAGKGGGPHSTRSRKQLEGAFNFAALEYSIK